MVSFKDNDSLGKVAKIIGVYSFGVDPIESYEDIIFAGGGFKFSNTCGFRFKSKMEGHPAPEFRIVFCVKLRSKIYHQKNTNPSKWFIFKPQTKNDIYVLSKKDLLDMYGFDINEFFKSDVFAKYLPRFEAACNKGLEDAQKYIAAQPAVDDKTVDHRNNPRSNAISSLKAITESIPLMQKPIINDKTYLLHNYDK